jgi:hypothetical protein
MLDVVNKPKIQGTKFETWLVNKFNSWGDRYKAERLAEGGIKDIGDVKLKLKNGLIPFKDFVIEAKARQNLNVHQTLAKSKKKAGNYPVILAWKKLIKQEGNSRRTSDGESVVYIIDEETLKDLLENYKTNL